jgi:hypothetical protein
MRSRVTNAAASTVVLAAASPGGLSSQVGSGGWSSASVIQMPSTGAEEDREYGSWHRMGLANGANRPPDGLSLVAAYNLLKGALLGVQQRSGG